MPFIRDSPNHASYLVYTAPVDEKTKKIREMFDVDEETGYPREYNWRSMAQLGKSYTFEEPFYKLTKSHPDDAVSSQVTYFGLSFLGSLLAQYYLARKYRRPFWSRFYYVPMLTGFSCAVGYYAQKKTFHRQALRNAVTIDYIRQHPERFGTVERPKLREVLFAHSPRRG